MVGRIVLLGAIIFAGYLIGVLSVAPSNRILERLALRRRAAISRNPFTTLAETFEMTADLELIKSPFWGILARESTWRNSFSSQLGNIELLLPDEAQSLRKVE